MIDLRSFWETLESLPGLAAVEEYWRSRIGSDWPLVRPFLRATRSQATSYPQAEGGLPYQVISHGEEDFVGVCPEIGETVTLEKCQLVVYELHHKALITQLSIALGIQSTRGPEDWDGLIQIAGHFTSSSGVRHACFLAFPQDTHDIQGIVTRLISERHAPFILLTPTRQWASQSVEVLLKSHACILVPLVESIQAPGPGRLIAIKPLESYLQNSTPFAPDTENRKNVFRKEGDLWLLRFAGKTVRVKHVIGLKYIQFLLESKHLSIDAVRLKNRTSPKTLPSSQAESEVLAQESREDIKNKLQKLTEQLEEAREFNNHAEQERLETEIEQIFLHLKSAQGLKGQSRKLNDELSKHRLAVTNAISRAIEKIKAEHPDLANHLKKFLQTGTLFLYSPKPDLDWDL